MLVSVVKDVSDESIKAVGHMYMSLDRTSGAGDSASGGVASAALANEPRNEECTTSPETVQNSQHRQLLHPSVLIERSRRVSAEQQVEIEKQTCLELTRLLELERRKVKQQLRRLSTTAVPLKTAASQSSGVRVGGIASQRRHSNETARVRVDEGKDEKEEALTEGTVDVLSPFEVIAPCDDSIGRLSAEFLFDNFSSTVFGELPGELKEMLRVEATHEDDYDEGQPPSVLSLAYRAVRTDNPRQLKEHLNVIGSAVLQSVEWAGLLGEACECGSDGCVRVLLDSGCFPDNSCRDNGASAIHLAAQNDHSSCISLLLKWGADPSLQDKDGKTPLFIALCEGYRECVDILLESGSSLLCITKMDYTVLHAAVSGNMSDVLRRLLVSLRTSHDSSTASHIINYRDSDGNTALHLAASRGFQQCVEVLCGCPQTILTVKDRWNRMALDISTADCRDILMSKDSKEVVVCVQARLPDTQQATPIAIGRAIILRHYKCLDVELLAAQTLEQYCHNLKSHIPVLEPDKEEWNHDSTGVDTSRDQNEIDNANHVKWAEFRPSNWEDRLRWDLRNASPRGSRNSRGGNTIIMSDLKVLHAARQSLAKMDLGGSSIASYRVGPLGWSPGELGKQQRGRNLHSMMGDRRGGGLGWITGGKPTVINITLKGNKDGCLDQLAFELMIPKSTLHHYISLVLRDRAVVLHGPQGCGKTYLAKNMAEFLKYKLEPTMTHILYISLHPSFKRDDLFRMLRTNGLLIATGEKIEKDGENSNAHIVILDDLDHISGRSTPSVLAELLTMLNYRGPLNPTWVDAVYSREGDMLYSAGFYYLKNDSYFIATRTQANGEALPVAAMDQFSHVALARDGEPCAGILYRQLVARLIHTRHGDTPHRWDKVYRCVCWIWELWQLYNSYMKQLDLAELSLGLKHMLQCPVESGSSDNIQSWLCQLWEHHVAPRIEETVLHSGRMEGQHHQQTVHLLLRAVVDRAVRPTCPLEMEAATVLLERLYPPTSSSFGPFPAPSSPHLRQRHASGRSDSFRLPTTTPTHVSPVHSIFSVPIMRHGHMGTPDTVSLGSESPNSQLKQLDCSSRNTDTSSLDRVRLRRPSSAKKTFRRLRSRTVSLFSRAGANEGRGEEGRGDGGNEGSGGEGSGDGGTTESKKLGSNIKKSSSTLPKIFRRPSRLKTPLPTVHEKRTSGKSTRDLEDFFDMLSVASANRFDDQRSPAPTTLMQSAQSTSMVTELTTSPTLCGPDGEESAGFDLDFLPPPLAMSMPDLLNEDTDCHPRSHSVPRLLPTVDQSRTPCSNRPAAESYSYVSPPHRVRQERQSRVTGAPPDDPVSEPLRRRVIRQEANIMDEISSSSIGGSPTVGHRASPLATTTYVYSPARRDSSIDDRRETGSGGSSEQSAVNLLYSPMDEVMDREAKSSKKEEDCEEGEVGEVLGLDRVSPDGKYLSEAQFGDESLPQRTFPDGEAVRRHQPARQSPSDPGQSEERVIKAEASGSLNSYGHRISTPVTSVVGTVGHLRPHRVLSEGGHCQSLEEINKDKEKRNSHILFDAGLSFISPHSPIVKGVVRGNSFSGGSPKIRSRTKPPISEHHEM